VPSEVVQQQWKSTIVERLDNDNSLEAYKQIKDDDLYWPHTTKNPPGPLSKVDLKFEFIGPDPKKRKRN